VPTRMTIRTSLGPRRSVDCVADAARALASVNWPKKDSARYRETARIVDDALFGHCNPTTALEAFRKLAAEDGVLIKLRPATQDPPP